MILRLTNEEVDLMRDALVTYSKVLNEKARLLCTSHTAEGIGLCCRRMEAETLAADLANRQSRLVVVDPARSHATSTRSGDLVPSPERAA